MPSNFTPSGRKRPNKGDRNGGQADELDAEDQLDDTGPVTATRALSGAAVLAVAAVMVAVAWGVLSRSDAGASAAAQRDPLSQPGIVQFRNSEHADAAGSSAASDPLMAPSIVQFRQSEHTDAAR